MAKKDIGQPFSTDRPIETPARDTFQRKDFAERIVKLIKQRGKADCLVIGIYGSWGEGKTSVIRLVEGALAKEEIATTYRFNPWTFREEQILLRQFFFGLSETLDQKLLSKNDKIKEGLKKYAGLLTAVPYVGEAMKNAADTIDETGNEQLKEKLSEGLKKYEKPIVIFLDDIDRLSKDEVHAVFRLVKLTGDLPNVTYILCFDDQMVAAAIGERFGRGDVQAGRDFLEKVIQVPLRLPQIPLHGESGLRQFTLARIQEVVASCEVTFTERQVGEFQHYFDSAVLPKLLTPRDAIRYTNAISFVIPMLTGEVDYSDLLLFEALRIFYPEHHRFVTDEREMFITSYSNSFLSGKDEEKVAHFKRRVDDLSSGLTPQQSKGVKALIAHLFPLTTEATLNTSFPLATWSKWLRNQRIASPNYFQRYLTYTVIKGQLQDNDLSKVLEAAASGPEVALFGIGHLVNESSSDEFLQKMRSRVDELNEDRAKNMLLGIAGNADLFPGHSNLGGLLSVSPQRMACDVMVQLLLRMEPAIQMQVLRNVVSHEAEIDMAFEFVRMLDEASQTTVLWPELRPSAIMTLKDRMILHSATKPFFTEFPKNAGWVINAWYEQDKDDLRMYLTTALERTDGAGLSLIRCLVPRMASSKHPDPYLGDFGPDEYSKCAKYCDLVLLIKSLSKNTPPKELDPELAKWHDREPKQTDVNIVRQFFHWHTKGPGAPIYT